MAYVAKHYVTIGRKLYTPGEVIDEKMDKKTIDRLMKLKAVVKMGKAEEEPEEEKPQQEAKVTPDGLEEEESSAEEDPADEDDEAGEEEAMDEEPAPEIDVMAAVVTQPEAEEKPKAKSTKKTSTAGRK
ncbi:MAG: hypothetical protein J6K72_08450 [Clostridia bacterium]|nr:hypothetical protein [Clostridia bacterium]